MKLDGGKPYMYQATFNGGASVTAGSIPPTYCHFGGDTYFTKIAHSTGSGTNNLTKGNYYGGDLTVTNESNTNYLYFGYSDVDTVMGDVNLTNNGDALLWFANTTKTPIYGDLTLDGGGEIRLGSAGAGDYLAFEGAGNQNVTIGDSVEHTVYRLLMNKASGSVVLNDSLVISNELKFTKGRIIGQEDAMVTLHDGIAMSGVTDSTYVEGAVKKVGNDAFTFPVGRQGHYMPIGISAPGATTDEFVAEYFNEDVSEIHDFSSKDSTLVSISTNEYWTLNRTHGTSDEVVTLSWADPSCDNDSVAGLLVTAWDTANAKWVDYGNGGTTGDADNGTIDSDGAVSDYTHFTIAWSDTLDCTPCRADAGEDTTLLWRQSYGLGEDSISGYSYSWTPSLYLSDADTSSPVVTIPDTAISEEIIYEVAVDNGEGCVATDEVELTVKELWPHAIDPSSLNSLNPNYFDICEAMENYFEHHGSDTAEDGESARFRRWQEFWRHRITFDDSADHGSLRKASEVMQAIASEEVNVCMENNSLEQKWTPFSPGYNEPLGIAHQGLIPVIWVHPTDKDTVYAGSRAGGIFRTLNATDSNPTWECISDLKKLPALGFNSIVVSADLQTIVASTSPQAPYFTKGYDLGVWFSTDGGDTWLSAVVGQGDDFGDEYHKESIKKLVMREFPNGDIRIFGISKYRVYANPGPDFDGSLEQLDFFNPSQSLPFAQWRQYMFHDIELDARGETDEDYRNTIWVSGAEEVCNYWDALDETYCHISGWEQASKLHLYKIDVSDSYNLGSSTGGEEENNLALNLTNQLEFNYRMAIEHVMDGSTPTLYAFYTQLVESNYDTTPTMTKKDMIVEKSIDNGSTFTSHYSVLRTENEDIIINPDVFRVSNDGKRMYFESGKSPQTSGRHVRRVTWNNTSSEWESENDNWWYHPTPINNTHADIRDIVVWKYDDSGLEDKIFVAHDGGLSYSESLNGSNKHVWELKNGTGLNNSEFFTVSTQIDDKDVSYLSGQDNGAFIFRGLNPTLPTWEHIEGGDGYELVYNQNQPSIDNYHYNETEESYYSPYNGISDGGARTIHPTRMMVDESNFIYFGHQEVMKYDFDESAYQGWNSGFTNTQLSNFASEFGTSEELQVAHVPRYRPDVIYAAKLGTTGNGADLSGVLFKCTGCDDPSTRDWEDIGSSMAQPTNGPINTAIAQAGIFDITTDPNDPDKVWVSFDGFREDRKIRVLYSDDGGDTWTDYSVGLPAVGVSRIIYQEGSNDLLYAGTDIGVYYRDASMTDLSGGWQCFSNDLPICLVSDLEIDYCERKLYASTFGRGGWITDIIVDNSNNELVINENTTWDSDKRIIHSVIRVESGYTLTIDDKTIKMPSGSVIIVEPGAQLTVDGGTLTNACGYNWEGIQVLGDPDEPQLSSEQGVVRLINGAVIEHAKVGIRGGDGSDCCTYSGGIVQASGSASEPIVIRNCRKGVELNRYSYGNTGQQSYFVHTHFLCDAPMNNPAYEVNGERVGTDAFATIWDQDNVRFSNCTFENTIDYTDEAGDPQEFSERRRSVGIRVIDADVKVQSDEPDHQADDYGSQFKGLTTGIEVYRTSWYKGVLDVYGAKFENCQDGILDEGSLVDEVDNCRFEMARSPLSIGSSDVTGYGVYMRYGISHTVTNNIFDKYDTQLPFFGYINRGLGGGPVNDMPSGGLLKWNTFNNTEIATQSENHNVHAQFLCNTYEANNSYDWAINPFSQGDILGPQGYTCDPNISGRAGNIFNDVSNSHLHNWGQSFDYFYNDDNNEQPDIEMINFVNAQNCDEIPNDASCDVPSNPDPPHDILVRQDSIIDVLDTELADIKADLDSSMTDTLLAHLADTNYSNATLKSELLQYSFLSDTVLMQTCERHPFFDEADFQDILLANSPVTREVCPYLDSAFSKIKVAYADTIRSAQGTDSLRTVRTVEREKERAATTRFVAINDIIRSKMDSDSIPDSTYNMIHFLADTLPEKQWKMAAVDFCIAMDTLSWARSILDSIPLDSKSDSAYYDFQDLSLDLAEDTLTWFDMDSTQNALVSKLVSDSTFISNRAQAVQLLLGDSSVQRIPEQIPGNPSWRFAPPEAEITSQESGIIEDLTVYPNPFNNQFSVRYVFSDTLSTLVFEVFDITGRSILYEQVSNSAKGVQTLDVGECKGLYILRITGDGQMLRSEKLICIER